MPIIVVGRPPTFKGRVVLEILCNLKNFGIGRIVGRSSFDKYPEPSYYKVLKVAPQMDENNICGDLWVDTVFRGRHVGPEKLLNLHEADYYLVAKEDEMAFCNKQYPARQEKILPKKGMLPPLVHAMVRADAALKGIPFNEGPQMDMVYTDKVFKNRIVRDETKQGTDIQETS